MENTNPQSFEDVKVFTGDNFHTAADATYKNLIWETTGYGKKTKSYPIKLALLLKRELKEHPGTRFLSYLQACSSQEVTETRKQLKFTTL